MIKLIIFDLDGTLIESTKELHYTALNKALSEIVPNCIISEDEHLTTYDALSTKQKLVLLSETKGLDTTLFDAISTRKQDITFEMLSKCEFNINYNPLFEFIRSENIKIAICTNSIKKTTDIILDKLGITELVDLVLTNEDVTKQKPDPEIFNKAISHFGIQSNNEVLIFEDSKYGIEAAKKTNSYVHIIDNVDDLNTKLISKLIYILKKYNDDDLSYMTNLIKPTKMNIIIPMSGKGSRFKDANYALPKPLIKVKDELSMIELVVNNINIKNAQYIFLVLKEHEVNYNISETLKKIATDPIIIIVDSVTEGAACTILLAKEYINNNTPLFITNCDQYVEWNSNKFISEMFCNDIDGGITTFTANDSKWSFVKLDTNSNVMEVAEKKVISDIATVGQYFYKKGSDFVKYAEQMIEKNIRVNNEFYVAPVYNEAIADGKIIKIHNIDKMWGLGTPEDLNYFLENYKL